MTDHRTWHVIPLGGGWTVEEDGGGSPSSALFTRAQALEQAAELVKAHPTGTIVVHRADGTVEGESQPGRSLYLVQG